jgi:ribosome biogenesis protein Nip4
MTVNEAEKIIEKFHQSIRDLRPDAIVQSNKALPYTSATIKYAHFVYGEDLIKNFVKISGKTPEELEIFFSKKYNELMESYGIIDSLFREDSEDINTKYKEFLKCLKKALLSLHHLS